MTTLNDGIEQGLTYIGRWAVHLETNKQVIIVDTEEHNFGYTATVIVPGEEVLDKVPAGDLRLIPRSVWNAEGVPQRFAEWESTLDGENFPKLEDIPQSTLRKYAENLKGCWVEQLGLYYLVLKYMQGATGDVLKTLNPITSAIKYIDIEDEARILPPEFREWGETTPEFLDMIEQYAPQPEDENTKPEEEDETCTMKLRNGQWVRNTMGDEEYIFLSEQEEGYFEGEWLRIYHPSECELGYILPKYLEPMSAYAWTSENLPIPTAYTQKSPAWNLAPVALKSIPDRFISKFYKELSGCWAAVEGELVVFIKIVGNTTYALNPKKAIVESYHRSEGFLLNPLMLRAWGNPGDEFRKAIEEQEWEHPYKPESPDKETDAEDAINPGHYRGLSNNAEVIDITENLTFAAGNVIKYVVRATRIDGVIKNNPVQDLEKARWYLDREIERLKNNQEET